MERGRSEGLARPRQRVAPEIRRKKGMERLDEAVELGINMVDTADAYGGGVSEQAVGRWLKERHPTDFVVSTKVGMISRPDGSRGVDLTREHIDRQLAQSLDRLGTVDLYMAHATDPVTPLEETFRAFSDAQDDGRIKCWGLSNVPVERIRLILDTADRLQPQSTVVDRESAQPPRSQGRG